MSFRFNFSVSSGKSDLQESEGAEKKPEQAPKDFVQATRIKLSPSQCDSLQLVTDDKHRSKEFEDLKVDLGIGEKKQQSQQSVLEFWKRRHPDSTDLAATGNTQLQKVVASSDVVPSVYEGGFKLWECAIDMLEFMHCHCVRSKGKHVLELGCGHGLPGLHCLTAGAKTVTLQDLNPEVLMHSAIPNALVNTKCTLDTITSDDSSLKFVAGDWRSKSMNEVIPSHHYQLILTSDTLYSVDSIPALLSMIERTIHPDGVALVAAKRFYFGVGGSTSLFLEHLSDSKTLTGRVLKVYEDGQSNIREVIGVKCKSNMLPLEKLDKF